MCLTAMSLRLAAMRVYRFRYNAYPAASMSPSRTIFRAAKMWFSTVLLLRFSMSDISPLVFPLCI